MEYLAFFFAIHHTEIDWLEEKLKTYLQDPNNYVMSMETSTTTHQETEGQHIHILATMGSSEYKKFSTIVIRKYKLSGKAQNGKGRQYGKLNVIRDLGKMLSYTLKDNNFRTNMDEQLIKTAYDKSYKKEEKLDEETKIMNYIKEQHIKFKCSHLCLDWKDPEPIFGFRSAAISVIEYFKQKNIETKIRYSLSRNQITTYVNKYFLYESETEVTPSHMFDIIFSSHNI